LVVAKNSKLIFQWHIPVLLQHSLPSPKIQNWYGAIEHLAFAKNSKLIFEWHIAVPLHKKNKILQIQRSKPHSMAKSHGRSANKIAQPTNKHWLMHYHPTRRAMSSPPGSVPQVAAVWQPEHGATHTKKKWPFNDAPTYNRRACDGTFSPI